VQIKGNEMKRGRKNERRRVGVKGKKANQMKGRDKSAKCYTWEVAKAKNKHREKLKMKVNTKFNWTQKKRENRNTCRRIGMSKGG
jgi:hypothetical protein